MVGRLFLGALAASLGIAIFVFTPFLQRAILSGLEVRRITAAEIAVAAEQAAAVGDETRVLFIGNSFTFGHDVPSRVAALAAADGRTIEVLMLAQGGARLADTLALNGMRAVLTGDGWAAIVLQDHSTAALDPAWAADSMAAITYAARLAGTTPVILVTPWARQEGHALYATPIRAGVPQPANPAAMTRAAEAHFAAAAAAFPAVRVAPVAAAWDEAIAAGANLHGPDRYHAAGDGAALAAEVIWETLEPLLPGD